VAEFGRIDVLVNNAAAQVVNEGLDDVTAHDVEGRQEQAAPAGLLDPGLGLLRVLLLGVEVGDRQVGAEDRG
jgi:NAD(P)-dependent dehydrogenase (short-subunit alcohol dehydrogenase family)